MTEFEEFWAAYPSRTAKLAAVKAFAKARKLASLDEILAGVERYRVHKPGWQEWAHPATWLNAGRWMDQYQAGKQSYQPVEREVWMCRHEPRCGNRATCAVVSARKVAS